MNPNSKKRLALAALIFAFAVAGLNAQIPGNMLGQAINQSGFDYVPEAEFNKVFQDFLATNYPRKNTFSQSEVEGLTTAFALYVVNNATVSAQWKKYAETQQATQQAVSFNQSGIANLNKREWDSAIANFTEAIRLNPNFASAYYNRGRAYSMKDDRDRAIADYTEAIRLDPNKADAYYFRGNALGYSFYDKHDYDRAIADLTQAIRLGSTWSAYYNRGDAYYAKGDYDRAIADYTESIRLDRNMDFAYKKRADAYIGKGDYDLAIADYTEAIRLAPNYTTYYSNRANAYIKKGNYPLARADVNKALQINSNYQDAKDLDAELKQKGY
jgi:tetratricopeptide (TPR) repeat protein